MKRISFGVGSRVALVFVPIVIIGLTYKNYSNPRVLQPKQEQNTHKASQPSVDMPPALFDRKKWMEKGWVDEDESFYALRKDIDQLDREKLVGAIDNYRDSTEKADRDFLSLFGWAYASHRAQTLRVPGIQSRVAYANRYIGMHSAKLPSCYEWARLRFLMTVPTSKNSDYKRLGLRLLQREPKDSTVKYFMLGITDLRDPNDKKLALKYIDELLTTEPVKVSTYTAIGWVYFKLMNMEKNLDYGAKAIAAYEEFLQKAPQNHEFRTRAADLIKSTKEEMEILRKTKNGKSPAQLRMR